MPTDTVRFAIVRLCECEGNVRQLIARHGCLTENGRQQALAVRRSLLGSGIRICVAPNNSACLESAAIIGDGASPHPGDEFREPPYPDYTGCTLEDAKRRFPNEFERLFNPKPGNAEVSIPRGGESFRATFERAAKGIRRLCDEFRGPGTIVVITHGEVVRLLTVGLLGAPLENLFRLRGRNGAITTFDYDGQAARFELINGSSHLDGALARDLHDDIVALA